MRRRFVLPAALLMSCIALGASNARVDVLPNGWTLNPAADDARTGTMPQGLALSPDGRSVAILESGVAPVSLRIVRTSDLDEQHTVPLANAFGRPVWLNDSHVLAAGAGAHAILDFDVSSASVRSIDTGAATWPACIALSPDKKTVAVCDDAGGSVIIGTLPDLQDKTIVRTGAHPADAVFSRDGSRLFVAVRQTNTVAVVGMKERAALAQIPVGLHPAALALSSNGTELYVAESDDDSVGVIDTATLRRTGGISVAATPRGARVFGASPNALALSGGDLFVSLGGENAIAYVRDGRLVRRVPTGWYPTGVVAASDGRLFVTDGKGEGAPPNPQYDPRVAHGRGAGYVGLLAAGSIRAIPRIAYSADASQAEALVDRAVPQWTAPPPGQTVIRAGGPIRHVIYVIKENRSYDQVLGDLGTGDGDPRRTWFGSRITPNQHALARRFGIFDRAFVDAQVSANGHNFTDAAFANDYVERFWPLVYGGRRELFDFQQGNSPAVPHDGYIWDAAQRAHLTYRDYGEDLFVPDNAVLKIPVNTMPGLTGHFDPRYIGFDLSYMDDQRYAEWLREFRPFEQNGNLPQLEIVYLPGDHTAGADPTMRTPQGYVAMNDWALGRLVDAVSHSRYWRSTAIFAIEDDAQDGPDHVSDQRSTLYVASAYARGGVIHEHYSTTSVLHTIEILLGMRPLSIYDAAARPLYAAFTAQPKNAAPYDAVRPHIDMNKLNAKTAYGARESERMDLSRPDAADPRELDDILAHAVHGR